MENVSTLCPRSQLLRKHRLSVVNDYLFDSNDYFQLLLRSFVKAFFASVFNCEWKFLRTYFFLFDYSCEFNGYFAYLAVLYVGYVTPI